MVLILLKSRRTRFVPLVRCVPPQKNIDIANLTRGSFHESDFAFNSRRARARHHSISLGEPDEHGHYAGSDGYGNGAGKLVSRFNGWHHDACRNAIRGCYILDERQPRGERGECAEPDRDRHLDAERFGAVGQ